MKRKSYRGIAVWILVSAMLIGLAGCGGSQTEEAVGETEETIVQTDEDAEDVEAEEEQTDAGETVEDESTDETEEVEEAVASGYQPGDDIFSMSTQVSIGGVWYQFPMDYSVLTDNGWEPVEEGVSDIYLKMENSEYPTITMEIFPKPSTGEFPELRWVSGFEENGVYGMMLIREESGDIPDIAFGNADGTYTVDSSEAEVLGVCGQPDYEYGGNYYSYSATGTWNDEEHMTQMSILFDDDGASEIYLCILARILSEE